ncbi:ferritin family protein [Candidatus Omnitrophota bacterium]
MVNVFSAIEVVEMGIKIEENGRDFYNGIIGLSDDKAAKEAFKLLSSEEEKHIKRFEVVLSKVKKYEPVEAYPNEYFSYIKSLSGEYVFIKEKKGTEIAGRIKTAKEAIKLGIGFEKDSILFYQEMKKFVLTSEQSIIEELLEEEKKHLKMLLELDKSA